MRKIHLHGTLSKYTPVIELDVQTAGEAVRALNANFPGFVTDLRAGEWHVIRGDQILGEYLDSVECGALRLGAADLHFVPAVTGAKTGGGALKTVLGVALVGAAFAFSGGALAAPIVFGSLSTGLAYGNLAMIGVGMALSGVSQLLAPEDSSKKDTQSSFIFNGPGNAYEQGSPVPLVYGEVICGGVLVSGGLDIEAIAVGV